MFADPIGGLTAGLPYYIRNINIANSTFTVSTAPNGQNSTLTTATGNMPAVATLTTGGTVWNQSTTLANETTGFFKDALNNPIPIGESTSTVLRYSVVGSLIRFVAPAGYYFDSNNKLQLGVPTRADERTEIWASPIRIIGDGNNAGLGNLSNGSGPVTLNNFIPTGAIVDVIIPVFTTDLPMSIKQQMTEQFLLLRNFGLGYDNDGSVTGVPYSWYLITSTNLALNAPFSEEYAGNTTGANLDASWVVQFVVQNQNYTITFRGLQYNFGSVLQTRFFFYDGQQVYDSRTGTVIKDFVNVLAVNTRPDSTLPLPGDIPVTITGQPVESDGYVDDFQVLVGFRDSDNDGIPDDPDFFEEIVAPGINSNQKYVFLEQTVDFDNLQRYILAEPGRVNSDYATVNDIETEKFQWTPGQVFYAYAENKFYLLSREVTGALVLTQVTDWIARTGRQGLYYQYRHNSPLTNRIDPGTTNIIDLYVVTQEYYTSYQNWLRDTTNTVIEPEQPSIDDLNTAYQNLQDYKMISDNIVLNSVTFKPLFGAKSQATLRATIKVIRAQGSTASTSEIKSSVIAQMNNYFSIDKWNFGDTFYFSELAAFLHRQLGTIISSVVLVPLDPEKSFGDLYEIRSQPNEIFANAATVDNIDVIEALTSTNLRTAPGSGVI